MNRCPMRLSASQINPDRVADMLGRAAALRRPPAKFGGWVFMGVVPEFYSDGRAIRRLLNPKAKPGGMMHPPKAVLVEGLMFVSVRLRCL